MSRMKTPDGIGGLATTKYQFGGGYYHKFGKGFIGFSSFNAYDEQDKAYQEQIMKFSRAGWVALPCSTETKYKDNGVSLYTQQTINTYTYFGTPEQPRNFFHYLIQAQTKTNNLQYDAMGAVLASEPLSLTTTTYDYEGSATIGTTTIADYYKRTQQPKSVTTKVQQLNSAGAPLYLIEQSTATTDYTTVPNNGNALYGTTYLYNTRPLRTTTASRRAKDNINATDVSQLQTAYTTATTYTYTDKGQVLTQNAFDYAGQDTKKLTTAYEYQPTYGNLTKTTLSTNDGNVPADENNRVTEHTTFDARYRYPTATRQSAPAGLWYTTTATYDARTGLPLTATDINGLTTTTTYDAYYRPATVTSPTGVVTTYQYQKYSTPPVALPYAKLRTTISNSANSQTTATIADALGRTLRTETKGYSGTLIRQDNTYNAKGEWVTATAPYYAGTTNPPTISKTYYPDGKLKSEVETSYYNPATPATNTTAPISTGKTTNYSYAVQYTGPGTNSKWNACGIKTTTTEQYGTTASDNTTSRTTTALTDATGKQVQATDPGGNLRYYYASHGNLSRIANHTAENTVNTQPTATYGNYKISYDAWARKIKLEDPDAGVYTDTTDAFGQVRIETDPKGNKYLYTYDKLGRVTSKVLQGTADNREKYYWLYNDMPHSNTAIKHVGTINTLAHNCTGIATAPTADSRITYTYDAYTRVASQAEYITGLTTPYTTAYTYNSLNQVINTTYPTGYTTTNAYNTIGYLQYVKNGTTNLYTCTARNAYGRATTVTLGNGMQITNTYTQLGHPTETKAQANTTNVFNYKYTWDDRRDLLTLRTDAKRNLTETFAYDAAERLTRSQIGSAIANITYAQGGSILTKTDAGNYLYDAVQPNAVAGITNYTTAIPTATQVATYTNFNKLKTLNENSLTATLAYNPLQQRELMSYSNGNYVRYATNYEEVKTGTTTRKLQYLYTDEGLLGMQVRNGTQDSLYYTHTDYLGNLLLLTGANGSIQSERSFDAWGRLRNPTNWSYTLGTTGVSTGKLSLTNRGFTGHEHLPSFGIINMNGRVYDPVLARFLSADDKNIVPVSTQHFNRYSYVLNNPLKYTDPSGWNEELPHEQGQNSAWTETTLSLLADMGGQWGQMANHIGETGNYKPNEDDTVSENDNDGEPEKKSGGEGNIATKFKDGVIDGAIDTKNFVMNLASKEGMMNLVENNLNIAFEVMTCPGCFMYNTANSVYNQASTTYTNFQNDPAPLSHKVSYSAGYFAEKAAELYLTKRVAGGGNINIGKNIQFSFRSSVFAPGMSGSRIIGFKFYKFQGAIDYHNWVMRRPGLLPINNKFLHYHWGRGNAGKLHRQFGTGLTITSPTQLRTGWFGINY